MKVTGPRSTQSTSGTRKKPGASGASGSFSVETAQESRAAAPMSGASGVSSVDAILALQSVGDFTQARKKATERAFSMLDVLDDLKLSLLEGGIPQSKLIALMDVLRSRRDSTHDSGLEAALDEVEIRAAVELAKLQS